VASSRVKFTFTFNPIIIIIISGGGGGIFRRSSINTSGGAVVWWLRHYATNRQFARSIPDDVIGTFQ
jgi:hypothetical protein